VFGWTVKVRNGTSHFLISAHFLESKQPLKEEQFRGFMELILQMQDWKKTKTKNFPLKVSVQPLNI